MANIKEFSGRINVQNNGGYIKKFGGMIDYKIDGSLSRIELMFTLTLLFEEKY